MTTLFGELPLGAGEWGRANAPPRDGIASARRRIEEFQCARVPRHASGPGPQTSPGTGRPTWLGTRSRDMAGDPVAGHGWGPGRGTWLGTRSRDMDASDWLAWRRWLIRAENAT